MNDKKNTYPQRCQPGSSARGLLALILQSWEKAPSLRVRAFTRELKLSVQQLLLNKFYRAEPPTPSPLSREPQVELKVLITRPSWGKVRPKATEEPHPRPPHSCKLQCGQANHSAWGWGCNSVMNLWNLTSLSTEKDTKSQKDTKVSDRDGAKIK